MSEQQMIHLTINHIPVEVPKGTKIMQAAQKLGIDIPHLCYHEDQRIKARCRLCSVEVVGKRRLLAEEICFSLSDVSVVLSERLGISSSLIVLV